MKNHIRDYATAAFRFYAKQSMSADKYKKKIYDEALEEYQRKQKGSGVSCPTEAAIMRAEKAVNKKLAEIRDMEAVELTISELRIKTQGRAIVQAIKLVYFKDVDKELKRGDIHTRVHEAELYIPASERWIYNWLREARKLFAEKRGLRI
ncbi:MULTISPECIES: hypothetical protein [Clostridium]|uniref:Uncharacterized protein n=1 Tax=Clostridium coskatii TaxID=1705578 RepID=A0A162JEM9_9CLOT|nr:MULTISPECIES: hypothetical protein [Clostridium]OAA94095.1 hypothetical protein WX73_03665 [Clostridium coskatii]OBR96657.1 hypothetical protein CLCOS_08190 [Clostridium coskatii]QXE20439.1 hypothetical protein B5S50_17220 [Clostridium sp. 001]